MTRIAILDDYLKVARILADWDRLPPSCSVTVFTEPVSDRATLIEQLRPFDVICIMRERTPFPAEVLEALPSLKLLVTSGPRNASIDLTAAARCGITVCGTSSSGRSTVELTWSLILTMLHRVHVEHQSMRAGGWQTELGENLEGKTLGLIGLGRLGSQVARLAAAFDMRVLAFSQNLTEERATECGATRVDKETLLAESDVVSLHLVLSDRSRHTIDAGALRRMKSTAYLVNTSRGGLVDTQALLAALEGERIAGAAIDVYDEEPLSADHPLRRAPRVLLTPHLGYVSRENLEIFYRESLEDVEAWFAGKPIRVLTAGA